jgi:hypothetical protein
LSRMDERLLQRIREKAGTKLRLGPPKQLNELAKFGLPDDAESFYAKAEPEECAEINNVRLWPISEVIAENTKFVPGIYIQPMGYVVFATTIFGDAFCFATDGNYEAQSAPIVLIAHDLERDEIKREELAKLAKPIAPDLGTFLEMFVGEKLDIEPLYPEFNPDE